MSSSSSEARLPGTWNVVRAVARVSFVEIIRDRVLYNILLVAVVLLFVSVIASQLTFITADRVVLDVGVSAVNLTAAVFGVFLGASALNREFERRTIYVALSRPITRPQFLLGKYAGIISVLSLNWLLLCLAFLAVYSFMGEASAVPLGTLLPTSLGPALVLLLLQSWVMAAIALAFSTYSSTAVSAMFTVGIYFVGNNVSELKAIAAQSRSTPVKLLSDFVSWTFPDLSNLNRAIQVTYGIPVTRTQMMDGVLYTLLWVAIGLILASVLVRTKET